METKTLTTTGGHEVVLKASITGFEKLAITEAYLNAQEMQVPGEEGAPRKATVAEQMRAINRKAFETVVISVDGKTDGVYEAIYNLEHNETEEVKAAINEVTDAKKK